MTLGHGKEGVVVIFHKSPVFSCGIADVMD